MPFGVSRAPAGSWSAMSLLLHTFSCASAELIKLDRFRIDVIVLSKLWLATASRRQRFLAGVVQPPHFQAPSSLAICLAPGHAAGPFLRFSKKGDRTLQRFRLEIVPLNADNISAGCKPVLQFLCWAFQYKIPTFAASKTRKQMGPSFEINLHQSRIMI